MSGHTVVESLGAFRGMVSSSFVPLEITRERERRGAPFSASMASIDTDGIAFTEIAARPHVVHRTTASIADGGSGFYKVSLMLSGCGHLVQDGREIVIQAGDLAIYDTSRPYTLEFDDAFKTLIVMFPKDRLDLPPALTDQLIAAPLADEHPGLLPIVSSYLSQFPSQLAPLPEGVRAKLAHTSLDLLGTLFADVLDASPAQRDPHQLLLQRICGYIDEHLGSPELSPGSIAAAHYISKRHLHVLFRTADTTVSSWIRDRRLERSRADLRDPALADRTVAAIAMKWGFGDAAHFSRVFKATYGVSPREFRVA
ncbi:helix-turn-helix domain-containing protein [Leucobacter aridicollis]|uniref:AraC-like DNA-binding protein n=1 Tax=Leucobacter aridicollis TaxID=283878 RepID=A0A852R154_9MICO|nr:helix-turn-helix domain-containing protein [Leucobacter aridicollis]MBL3682849.1 helix-turn-helix domain-containing protein [Leucobacter aridicollis]NYD26287.1 AraC-like DNA-binding protein [Leucobacter aridicollis]